MKLRYYLRGLAVGILLTTIILTIANAGNKPLTDAQIKQRAAQLGMVEGDSLRLSALQSGSDQSTGENAAAKESVGEKSSSAEGSTAESNVTESKAADDTAESGSAATGSISESSAATGSASESSGATESSVASSKTESSATTGSSTAESSAASSKTESSAVASSASGTGSEGQLSDRPVTIEIQSGASSYTVSQSLAAAGLVEDARKFDDYLCDNGYASKIHIGVYEILPGTSEKEIADMIAY